MMFNFNKFLPYALKFRFPVIKFHVATSIAATSIAAIEVANV
jgi:hypothetical protein